MHKPLIFCRQHSKGHLEPRDDIELHLILLPYWTALVCAQSICPFERVVPELPPAAWLHSLHYTTSAHSQKWDAHTSETLEGFSRTLKSRSSHLAPSESACRKARLLANAAQVRITRFRGRPQAICRASSSLDLAHSSVDLAHSSGR